jgi:hypothetical protein
MTRAEKKDPEILFEKKAFLQRLDHKNRSKYFGSASRRLYQRRPDGIRFLAKGVFMAEKLIPGFRVKLVSIKGIRNKNLKGLLGTTGRICWMHSERQINVEFDDHLGSRFTVRAELLEKIDYEPVAVGDIVKHKNWTWGGRVLSVAGNLIFILVGNEETGETYPVRLADCEKKHPATGRFEPVELEPAKKPGRAGSAIKTS